MTSRSRTSPEVNVEPFGFVRPERLYELAAHLVLSEEANRARDGLGHGAVALLGEALELRVGGSIYADREPSETED